MSVNIIEKDILATIAAAQQGLMAPRKLDSKLAGHQSSFRLHAQLRFLTFLVHL